MPHIGMKTIYRLFMLEQFEEVSASSVFRHVCITHHHTSYRISLVELLSGVEVLLFLQYSSKKS